MSDSGGIELPIRVPAEDAVVTLEKLAARLLELEEAMRKTGKAGSGIGQGLLQGMGQKVWAEISAGLERIPAKMEAAINAAAGFGDAMTSLSQRSGFSTTQLQEMSLAAQTSGLNLNMITRYATALTPKLLQNRDAFEALGLTFEQVAKADPGQQFDMVAKKLAAIEDPVRRSQAAIEIFGKRLGPMLLPFLDSMEEGKKRSRELGLVWDKETTAAAAKFDAAQKTLDQTTQGLTKSLGLFIAADPDLRAMLESATTKVGQFNKYLQSLADDFHALPTPLKAATAGIVLFSGELVGWIPTAINYFGVLSTVMGAGGFTKVAKGAADAMKAFAVSALPALTALGALAAIVGAIVGGALLGEWLYDNVKWFRQFIDVIAGAVRGLGEFLGLLPDEEERRKMEQGTKWGVGVDPKAMAEYEAHLKRVAELKEKGAQAVEVRLDKEQLEQRKAVLAIEGQIGGLIAQRSGAVAAANQQAALSIQMAQLDLDIKKAALDDQKLAGEITQQKYEKELGKVRELTAAQVNLIQLQRERAIADARLAEANVEVDRASKLADLDAQITRTQTERIGVLAQIEGQYQDAADAATREMLAGAEKIQNEIVARQLQGEALLQKQQEIEFLAVIRDRQLALAEAQKTKALQEEKYNRELARGLVGAKDEQQVIAEIVVALENKKAIISERDLTLLDAAAERAKRLGQEFAAYQARADEAFKRIQSQEATKAIAEIDRKLRLAIRLTPSDLQGLIDMREGLAAGSEAAGKLDAAIANLSQNYIKMRREEAARSQAISIVERQVNLEVERWMRTKEGLKYLQEEVRLRLIAAGVEAKKAAEIARAQVAQIEMNRHLTDAARVLDIIGGLFEDIGISADTTAGKILGMANATLAAAQAGQAAKEAWKSGDKIAAIGQGAQVAGNIWKSNATQRSGAQGALSGAAQGAAFGAQFGPWGALIGGVGGALVGFFAGSKFRKIAKDAGKVLGEGLSDETIKKIEADSKKLGISVKKAALLSISSAIADTGKTAGEFGQQIEDLMKGIADKSIPAKEGIEELGKSWGAVRDEAMQAGRVGDAVMVDLIKRSRELKIESPEIKAFVGEQLDAALAGTQKFLAGVKAINKEWLEWVRTVQKGDVDSAMKGVEASVQSLGNVSGVVFGAMFSALASERGIVAAVDALGEDFTGLQETLKETLGEEATSRILAPFAAAFATINDEHLRPLFEGIDGLSQAMKGLANAGFLSRDQFSAMQQGIGDMFDLAIAGGADMRTALEAVSPAIQTAISAAEQFGVPLDADTQRLKALAEQNGITFKTDPQRAMLDVLVSIADVLGAKIPDSVARMRESMTEFSQDATSGLNNVAASGADAMAELAAQGGEVWGELTSGADALANAMSQGVPDAADIALEALERLREEAARGVDVDVQVRGHIPGGEPELEGGGIVNAPLSGMRAILHGPEAIIPLDRLERWFDRMPSEPPSQTSITVNVAEDPYATNETRRQAREFTLDAAADAIARNAPL